MRSKMRKRTDTKTVTEHRGQGTGGNRTEGGGVVDTSIEQGQGQAAVEKGEKRTEEGEAKMERLREELREVFSPLQRRKFPSRFDTCQSGAAPPVSLPSR